MLVLVLWEFKILSEFGALKVGISVSGKFEIIAVKCFALHFLMQIGF